MLKKYKQNLGCNVFFMSSRTFLATKKIVNLLPRSSSVVKKLVDGLRNFCLVYVFSCRGHTGQLNFNTEHDLDK